MNTIEVPMMKEIFMQGLLNNISSNHCNTKTVIITENGISSFKDQVNPEPIEATILQKYLNGERKPIFFWTFNTFTNKST